MFPLRQHALNVSILPTCEIIQRARTDIMYPTNRRGREGEAQGDGRREHQDSSLEKDCNTQQSNWIVRDV